MHIPDAYLGFPIAILFWIVSFAVIAFSYKRLTGKNAFKKERIPLVAAATTLVFALQMLNFPIVSGTSGHFVGGVLLAFLFGFDVAVLSMAAILFVQAFVFHDGGVLALGANIFNMGVLAPLVGIKTRSLFYKYNKSVQSHLAALFTGSFAGTLLASVSAALQIGLSGTVPVMAAVSSMAFYHAFIGLGEGAIGAVLLGLSLAAVPIAYRAKVVQ